MSPGTLTIALLLAVVVWGLISRKLTAKPWEPAMADGSVHNDYGALQLPPARIAFYALLAVISSFFLLFMSAYLMRMDPGHGAHDWHVVREPQILWLNTALLILASVAMQGARHLAARAKRPQLVAALLLGGLLTLAFLGGQVIAWSQMAATMPLNHNPASAFFVLLTALHGLHLLGGLVVWGLSLVRLQTGSSTQSLQLGVELCSIYWHYLLVVWLLLFTLLLVT